MKKSILFIYLILFLTACKNGNIDHDASGIFEANEVIVSSEVSGKILKMIADEGVVFTLGQATAIIDTTTLLLQKDQVEASIKALNEKTSDPAPYIQVLEQQLIVQQSQLATAEKEFLRVQNLIAADAATGKQLDDITAQIDVLNKQMDVTKKQIIQQRKTLSTQNRSILSEQNPLEKKSDQIKDQLKKATVSSPIAGTVLTKYAEAGEFTTTGKALYKIADLSSLTVRAYITGEQLSQIKLNQTVKIFTDDGADKYKTYNGTIIWISDKAEFTPKTIQTKDERANLVYAIKIKVKNDGLLKIGMYAEVGFK